MKKSSRVLSVMYICILLVFISICSFFIYYFCNLKNEDVTMRTVSVVTKQDINYNVLLKNNDYYIYNSDNEYNINDIDDVMTNYVYQMTFSDKVEGEYSYYVVGSLVSENETTEIVKTEEKKFDLDGNVINIVDSFSIDLDNYINNLNGVLNSYINYTVYIKYSVYDSTIDKKIDECKEMYLNIPVTNVSVFTTSEKVSNTNKYYSDYNDDDNNLYLIIVVEFVGAIIFFILSGYLTIKKMVSNSKTYDRVVEKILKKNDDLIVSIKTIPDLTKFDVLFVKSFKDIKEAAYNLDRPINYINIVSHQECIFIVISHEHAYVYKLRKKDMMGD